MLKNENIICISSIDWDFIWQSHQEIMSTLSKSGNRVLFIENTGVRVPGIRDIARIKSRIKNWFSGVKGIREIENNLYVFSPIIFPFPYLRTAKLINHHLIFSVLNKWIKIMDFSNPVIWVFLPTPLSLDIIDNLNHKIVVYYCVDNFRASSAAAKKIKNSEVKLLKIADLVFTTSKELCNYCRRHNDNVYKFPNAVSFEKFEKIRLRKPSSPEELRDIETPIIGYVGGMHKWMDLNLIKEAAQKFPQYSFVFVGPIQTDISLLTSLKNVYFLGIKDHRHVPDYINSFDACLIPYLITDYTNNVYPAKLNEYHALGKPVISTELPEVVDFNRENDNLVLIGKNHDEFISCISNAINDSGNTILIEQRISSAKRNSLAARIEQMNNLIGEAIVRKFASPVDWQANLIRVYRAWRRKTIKIASVTLSIYLFIFYTPVVWFLASPLKISQAPKKADCIVVFAGGVGESGKAEGYEERVQYAVELFNKGYAKYLLFSSGYTRTFHEPMVMKALAIALGVPGEKIFLEDKARNTYENVKFSKLILEKNNWSDTLLVSSPYHMLRVSLVFGKMARDIKVVFVPVLNNSFYSHPERDRIGRRILKRINLQQIRGIFHEYLGILYYWMKGYIKI